MKNKSILIISAFPPNQKTAGQDYTRRLILDLISKDYSVSIIYAEYPGHIVELPKEVNVLKTFNPSFKNCFCNLRFHPFFTRRFNKDILNFINSIASNFSVLYFDFSQVHIYSKYIEHPFKVLMCHDVIAQKYTRKGKLQLPFIKKCENSLLKSAKTIFTPSKKDSEVIENFYGIKSYNINQYLKEQSEDFSSLQVLQNTFCFYGAWNRKENFCGLLWFIKKVFPLVKNEINFVILGGGLNEKQKNQLSKIQNFKVLGFVDFPVQEIFKCQALIAPLFTGAGVKVKVIDSLTCGTSVIGTDVAFEGIEDNKKNKLFFLAKNPIDFENILNNWKPITKEQKLLAKEEFVLRFDKNHFPEYIG